MKEENKEIIKVVINAIMMLLVLSGGAYTLYDVSFNDELHQTKEIINLNSGYNLNLQKFEFENGLLILDYKNTSLEKEVKEHNYRSYEHIATKDYPIYMALLGFLFILNSIKTIFL